MKLSQDNIKEWFSKPNNVIPLLPSEIHLSNLIRAGGQGSVFLGDYKGTPAAVKIYFPGQHSTRVEREVNALACLKCDSIVNLLWYGNITVDSYSLPVVVTDYVKGLDLEEFIKKRPLTEAELGKLAYDVTLAIKSMWDE
jgi:serine/threonine protein kinase